MIYNDNVCDVKFDVKSVIYTYQDIAMTFYKQAYIYFYCLIFQIEKRQVFIAFDV